MLTDLHCHLLPGIDDGARDLAQSLAMARIAVEHGISTTVVTPHHLNGVYTNPAATVREATAALQTELDAAGIALRLLPGAELHLTPELPDQLRAGEALTLADHGSTALVELPVHTIPVGAEYVLEDLLAMGITPLIAHPERNVEMQRHPERLADWASFGCLGQITAQSCIGKFGDGARTAARAMIRAGSIHVVASDAHRDHRRIPATAIAREPIEAWAGEECARLLIEVHPGALADGQTLNLNHLRAALPAPRRKRWWLLGA